MNDSPTLTMKQEEAIQALLLESNDSILHPRAADDEIQFIINNVNQKNKHLAQNKLLLNRGAINIEEEDFNIDNIISQVEQLAHTEVEEKVKVAKQKQGFFQEFDRNEIFKLKITEEEFVEIEGRYPKVKECLGQKIQYPCVKVQSSKVQRWFAFNQKDISNISDAILFVRDQIQYRMYCIQQKLYCFTSSDNYCEPLTLMPTRNKQIVCLGISLCKKYIVIGLLNEIVVYQVNSPRSFSLVKNITDLKISAITAVGFCGNGFERVYVVDSQKQVTIVGIEKTFIFYRVEINKMDVCLNKIISFDFMKLIIDDDEFHIIAFSSNTEIAIYLLFPFLQLLHIENFEDDLAVSRTKSNTKGNAVDQHSVKIKWRYKQNSSVKPLLIISFWNRIIILKMVQANNDIVPFMAKFVRFLYFTNHYPIINIGLISYNHLLIQSTHNTLIVAIPLITSSDAGQQCEQSSIIYVTSLVYVKLFPSNSGLNKLILTSEAKVDIFEVLKLQDYIDKQLAQKNDYMNIFSLLLLISKGLNYCFVCDYQEHQLTKIIFYCVQNLLVSLSKVKTDQDTLAIRLYWVCELLIESSRQHLIWSVVFSNVKNTLKKCNILFSCLQGFFMKGMIHTVPPDIFNLIVENYLARNKSKLLLKSIMSLDLEEHNVEKYLEQINQKEMYSLFIYLFQNLNQEGDYLTPFVKLFSSFKKSQQVEKKQYLGKLCMWYLYKSIKGVKFPQTLMSSEEKQLCFQNLIIEPLNPIFSKHLLDFDQQIYLTIYLYICTNDQIAKFVNKNINVFLERFRSFNDTIDANQDIFKQIISFVRKVYGKQSTTIHQFISLSSLKNPVDPELLYQTCLYYLVYPNLISQQCLWIINPIEKDPGKILLHMLMKLRGLLKSNKLYLKKLMSHKSYHWEVVSYLHSLDGKYKVAIQSLLDSEKRDNIFVLIKQIIKQIEGNPAAYTEVQGLIHFQVGRLIRISSKQTLLLLKQLKIDIQSVLKHLKQLPELKLQLITSIILDNQKEGVQQNMNFLVEHLELVCQFDKANLMKYLNHINYPLDDCAKVCQRHNQFEGKAFIQGRSGDILGALHSYEKAIISKIKDSKNLQPHIFKPLLQKYFYSAMILCKNNPCSSVTPVQQNNWLCLMQITKDIQDHKYSQKVDVMVELNSYFNIIYQKLFNHVPAKILLQYFLKGNRGFLPRILLKSWYSLSILFRFQHSMYNMAIQTNVIDTALIMDQYSQQKWKGIYTQSVQCCFCDNPLIDQKQLVFFSCRHFFHKICHKNKLCLACKFQSDSLLVKSMLDKMMTKRKESQCWTVNKQKNLNNNVMSDGGGVIVIQLENPEQRRKRLKQKLKSFEYQKIKNDNIVQESLEYYFQKKQIPSQTALSDKDHYISEINQLNDQI